MNEEELALRIKFYLAPKNTTYEQLVQLNEKYAAYPGLTLEQARETHAHLMELKSRVTHK